MLDRFARLCLSGCKIALGYHAISDENPPHIRHILQCKSTKHFEQDLDWLAENGHFVDAEEFEQRQTLRDYDPSFHLTLDDGYRECMTNVLPILNRRAIRATFFVVTGTLDSGTLLYRNAISLCIESYLSTPKEERRDLHRLLRDHPRINTHSENGLLRSIRKLTNRDDELIHSICDYLRVSPEEYFKKNHPYLSETEILKISSVGHTIGAHSKTHPSFRIKGDSSVIEDEIVSSCERICAITGSESVPFSFPFGASRVDRDLVLGIASRHPCVGTLYDATGLASDHPGLVNRLMADDVRGAGPRSNLPRLILRAWIRGPTRRAKARIRTAWIRSSRSSLQGGGAAHQ